MKGSMCKKQILPKITLKQLSRKRPSKPEGIDWFSLAHHESAPALWEDKLYAHEKLHDTSTKSKAKELEWQHRLQSLDRQWINLTQKENLFRKTIIAHSQFLKMNSEKQNRAILKFNYDRKRLEMVKWNIDDIKFEIETDTDVLKKMRTEISKLAMYENFLMQLVGNHNFQFKTINDLMKRWEILEQLKVSRTQKQYKETGRLIMVHQGLVGSLFTKHFTLIGLRTELNNLRSKFEELSRRNAMREYDIAKVVNICHELSGQLNCGEIMIETMYRYICERRGMYPMALRLIHVEPKLDLIKRTLHDWKKVIRRAERHAEKSEEQLLYRQSLSKEVIQWKPKDSQTSKNQKKGSAHMSDISTFSSLQSKQSKKFDCLGTLVFNELSTNQ